MIKKFEQFNVNDPYGEEDWEGNRYDYMIFKGSLREFLESIREESPIIDAALTFINDKDFMEDGTTTMFIMSGLRELGVDVNNRNKIYEELFDYQEKKFSDF